MNHWIDLKNVGSYVHWLIDFHTWVTVEHGLQLWRPKNEFGRTYPLSHTLVSSTSRQGVNRAHHISGNGHWL